MMMDSQMKYESEKGGGAGAGDRKKERQREYLGPRDAGLSHSYGKLAFKTPGRGPATIASGHDRQTERLS